MKPMHLPLYGLFNRVRTRPGLSLADYSELLMVLHLGFVEGLSAEQPHPEHIALHERFVVEELTGVCCALWCKTMEDVSYMEQVVPSFVH
ncbi:MAG: hypothetical protein AAF787_20520, partial [Chloroflexota bacterium]